VAGRQIRVAHRHLVARQSKPLRFSLFPHGLLDGHPSAMLDGHQGQDGTGGRMMGIDRGGEHAAGS
jgi:hypothetical protein